MTIFLLSAIIIRPFTGKILDLVGKRKMLWISLLFYLICTILYYFTSSFILLLILRFVQGIWFSIATTASVTLAADNIPNTRRGAGLGYFMMSTNLAVVIGPFIGLFIIQSFSFDLLFILLSVLMLAGALLSLTIAADQPSESILPKRKLSLGDLIEKKALPISLLSSLVGFSYASVLSYLSIYAQQKDLLSLASTFFLVFAAAMVVTRPITGRIFDEKGPKFILIPSFISFLLGLVILTYMNSPLTFMLAGIFFGFGYGGIVPSLQTLAIQATSRERSGYATATFFTFWDLGIAVGSYFLGLVAVHFGYQNMYLLSALVILIRTRIYLKRERKSRLEMAG